MMRIAKAATVIAAMGAALFGGAGLAAADAGAEGYTVGSPGVLSGNLIQVPIHIPVNVCGNTVSVLGALNPAFGNRCENGSGRYMGGQGGQDNRGEGNWGQDNRGEDNRGGDNHSGKGQMSNHHHSGDEGGQGGTEHQGGDMHSDHQDDCDY
ncbi:chaplin [Streptomyces sp. H39-S7]|uniref:chaplin n=1 Tax=Streptomyces sp. H39-S7 TaxID=3004357 RepID=UPI003FA711D6